MPVTFCGQRLGAETTDVVCRDPQLDDLSPLACLAGLQRIDLAPTPTTDPGRESEVWGAAVTDLSPLSMLTQLRVLRLDGSAPLDLNALSGLMSLRELSLVNVPVAGLAPLASLGQLETLDLRATPARDLAPLAKLTRLRRVRLSEATRYASLEPLRGLVSLRELVFQIDHQAGPVVPASLVSRMTELRALTAANMLAGDASLAALTALRELRVHTIDFDHVDPKLWPELRLLHANGFEGDLASLRGMKRLEEIAEYGFCEVQHVPLDWLPAATKRLAISGTSYFHNGEYRKVRPAVPGLQPLSLLPALEVLWHACEPYSAGPPNLGAVLRDVASLKELEFWISPEWALALAAKPEHLKIVLPTPNGDAVKRVSDELRSLRHLSISPLDSSSVAALRSLTELRSLELKGNPPNTVDVAFVVELPNLRRLSADLPVRSGSTLANTKLRHLRVHSDELALALPASLETLVLSNLRDIPITLPAGGLPSLQELEIHIHYGLRSPRIAAQIEAVLASSPALERLTLAGGRPPEAKPATIDLTKLAEPAAMHQLALLSGLTCKLSDIAAMTGLRELRLDGLGQRSLEPLRPLVLLQELTLPNDYAPTTSELERFRRLRTLWPKQTRTKEILDALPLLDPP